MRVLIVTTFFPNTAKPQRSVFVKNLVQAMMPHCAADVVSPVPYAPPFVMRAEWAVQRAIPLHDTMDGIEVEHPRFIVVPKLNWFTGFSYFLGIVRTLRSYIKKHGRVILHAHCGYPDAVGVALAAKLLRVPYVVTAHGSDINVYAEQPVLRFQIRWALRNAVGIVAVSGLLRNKITDLLGRDKEGGKLVCIPCAAFNPDVFFPRPRLDARTALQVDANARVVVFVGLLVPIKGLKFLLDAWIELNKRGKLGESDRLVLLGDGPERKMLEQRMQQAQIVDKVRFVGTVTQAEVGKWMSAASLLCLPSLNEGTPNVVVEALASGVPVVASRVGGIPDLVRDGENGMLVPPTDVHALANALDAVLNQDWNAQTVAQSVAHLTWRSIAERNCEFLQTIWDKP
jgi:teichuronic acid biosynthesis glycosyltransferase TuaC